MKEQKISSEDVIKVAKLARLRFSDEEIEAFKGQLNTILEYVAKLEELDTSGVEPTFHLLEHRNVVRADEVKPSLSQEEALQNAPVADKGHFVVPKIIE